MIGYTMVGTNNLERAIKFYDPLMAEMGLDQRYRDDLSTSWGRKGDDTFPFFFVGYPFDGGPATVGNGVMTAFRFDDNAALLTGSMRWLWKMAEVTKARPASGPTTVKAFKAPMFVTQTETNWHLSATMPSQLRRDSWALLTLPLCGGTA